MDIDDLQNNLCYFYVWDETWAVFLLHPEDKGTLNPLNIMNPVLLTQYCAGGKIEKNEMGGACGAYGGGERCAQGSGGEAWGKETTGETQT